MMMKVEILGKTRREYSRKDGSPGVAHNLTILTTEGAGSLFVSEQVWNEVPEGYRGAAELVFGGSVFRGDVRPRVIAVRLNGASGAK